MKEPEMQEIGWLIAEIIHAPESEEVRNKVRHGVAELAARFPLYAKRLKGLASNREAISAS
jgi:glycine/serine hydroxymethyltransferase